MHKQKMQNVVVSEVTKILLDAQKEKEWFLVKIKESTCVTFVVGQFRKRSRIRKVLFGQFP